MPPEQIATAVLPNFEKYGLEGLVIFVLFCLVFYLLSQIKIIVAESNARFEAQSNLHAEERKDWKSVVKDMTHAYRTLSVQFEARLK